MDTELNFKACKAAKRYLELKGLGYLDIIDDAELPVLVADDEGELVFASVAAELGTFPEDNLPREDFEQVAAGYLEDHEHIDIPVRFDAIAMMVVADSRALLRHNINCLGYSLGA